MSRSIDREKHPPSGSRAVLPAIPVPPNGDKQTQSFLACIKEIIEVREGRRGSAYEKAVTWRDLWELGLLAGVSGGTTAAVSASQAGTGNSAVTTSIIEAALKKSVFFNQLVSRVGSAEALAHLPAELRRLLSSELTTEARERRADIKVVESKVQSDIESLSYRMETITAGVESAQAGVRQMEYAYADATQALSGAITQVSAALDALGSDVAQAEQIIEATANAIDGLTARWQVRVQAGASGAAVILGVTQSADGQTKTSEFNILADAFNMYSSVNGATVQPFQVNANGLYLNTNLYLAESIGTEELAYNAVTVPSQKSGGVASFPIGVDVSDNGGFSSSEGAELVSITIPAAGTPQNNMITVSGRTGVRGGEVMNPSRRLGIFVGGTCRYDTGWSPAIGDFYSMVMVDVQPKGESRTYSVRVKGRNFDPEQTMGGNATIMIMGCKR